MQQVQLKYKHTKTLAPPLRESYNFYTIIAFITSGKLKG